MDRTEPAIAVPPELCWDYATPPADPLWHLQRLGEWFPRFGRDRRAVHALFHHRAELRLPAETVALIELYEEAWRAREAAGETGDRR